MVGHDGHSPTDNNDDDGGRSYYCDEATGYFFLFHTIGFVKSVCTCDKQVLYYLGMNLVYWHLQSTAKVDKTTTVVCGYLTYIIVKLNVQ